MVDLAKMPSIRAYKLPDNNLGKLAHGGRPERLVISQSAVAAISLDDGSIHELPLGTRMVVVKPRRECNDWYAEIEGPKHVSATGLDVATAFLAALAKAA